MFQTERLKALRKSRRQTQAAVAAKINVTREAYSMYETGNRQPSCQSVVALSFHFHVSADYLLGLAEDSTTLGDLNDDQLYLLHSLPHLDSLTVEYLSSSIRIRYPELNPKSEQLPFIPEKKKNSGKKSRRRKKVAKKIHML